MMAANQQTQTHHMNRGSMEPSDGCTVAFLWLVMPLAASALLIAYDREFEHGIAFFFTIITPYVIALGMAAESHKGPWSDNYPEPSHWRYRILGIALTAALAFGVYSHSITNGVLIGWLAALYAGFFAFCWKVGGPVHKRLGAFVAYAAALTVGFYLLTLMGPDGPQECRDGPAGLESCSSVNDY